jgi:hypothetical protein
VSAPAPTGPASVANRSLHSGSVSFFMASVRIRWPSRCARRWTRRVAKRGVVDQLLEVHCAGRRRPELGRCCFITNERYRSSAVGYRAHQRG